MYLVFIAFGNELVHSPKGDSHRACLMKYSTKASAKGKLEPLPPSEWNEGLHCVLRDMAGQPLNVHGLMAHNPDLLAAWWDLRQHVVHGGLLNDRHRELIVLRVAAHTACWYEWASHVQRGLSAGLTASEIDAVMRPAEEGDWADCDRLLLQAVDDSAAFNRILPGTREALQAHFNAAQLLDITAIYGTYVLLATLINTWGLEVDEFVRLPQDYSVESWPAVPNSALPDSA